MPIEVTFDPKVEELIEKNVVPVVSFKCLVCGRLTKPEDLDEFVKGAAYKPPDPFTEGMRVVNRCTGVHGKVTESKLLCLLDQHAHRRIITVQPDDKGGRSFYNIEEGSDTTEVLILEKEWKVQQGKQ